MLSPVENMAAWDLYTISYLSVLIHFTVLPAKSDSDFTCSVYKAIRDV